MIWPSRTIWDMRIQGVCAVLIARAGDHMDAHTTGNFGQVSLTPPRIAINPNRLYRIEPLVRQARCFSLNVMAADRRDEVIRLIRLRRREPDKLGVLGWTLAEGSRGPIARWLARLRTPSVARLLTAPCLPCRRSPLRTAQDERGAAQWLLSGRLTAVENLIQQRQEGDDMPLAPNTR
jgi:flavin reductase (DIM6/NTAB) family NADH-FMN oxidoreductase RutF